MYTNSDFIYKINDLFMFLLKTSNDDPRAHTYVCKARRTMYADAAVAQTPRQLLRIRNAILIYNIIYTIYICTYMYICIYVYIYVYHRKRATPSLKHSAPPLPYGSVRCFLRRGIQSVLGNGVGLLVIVGDTLRLDGSGVSGTKFGLLMMSSNINIYFNFNINN